MIYLYILTGLIGFSTGFCFHVCCFPNKIQIDTDELDEIDILHDYIKYLEDMLNDSTNVATESVALNNIDVSCNNITDNNISLAQINTEMNLNENLPTAPPLPSATLVSFESNV
jgi:hypothetical protein